MNILILTGKFGMGHWSASMSLRQQLLRGFPQAEVRVLDFFDYAIPDGGSDKLYKAFTLLVTHGSGLYNTFYKLTENGKQDGVPLFVGSFAEKLGQLLDEEKPDAIVATHPICSQIVSWYKQTTGSKLPLVTCVTDLTAHSEWLCAGTDCYLVGAPALRAALMAKGVPGERILVTGIPVKEEFKNPSRRSLDGKRHLLIMGGGLGLMPRGKSFYEELNALPNVKTTIITGGNQKLYERLAGKYENIEVLGFTDKVYDYMASADLMLSKPGGITVFEAINSGLPILAWEPFLQQERNNANFLVRAGIGRIAEKEQESCMAAIRELIYDDDILNWMRDNMDGLKEQLEVEGLDQVMARIVEHKEVCA